MTQPPRRFLTQEFLKSILDYNPQTGIFVWRHRADRSPQWNGKYAGKVAGHEWSPNNRNIYISIRINDYPYMAHNLATLYMTGSWPKELVDHHDLDGTNNRWGNLRPANHSQNGSNRDCNKNSKTGVKGVSMRGGRFRATIQINRTWKQIGTYGSLPEAKAAYETEARRLYGEFARTQ